jgi:hypothetical protein
MTPTQIVLTLVFARLAWLSATCPCDPLFGCHAAEATGLAVVGLAGIGASLAGWFPSAK